MHTSVDVVVGDGGDDRSSLSFVCSFAAGLTMKPVSALVHTRYIHTCIHNETSLRKYTLVHVRTPQAQNFNNGAHARGIDQTNEAYLTPKFTRGVLEDFWSQVML